MANDNLTLERSATAFLGTLTDQERKSLAEFLNSPTAICEMKSGILPFEFIQLTADALQRAGLD